MLGIRDQGRLRTEPLAPAQTPKLSQGFGRPQLGAISARFSCVLPQSLHSSCEATLQRAVGQACTHSGGSWLLAGEVL